MQGTQVNTTCPTEVYTALRNADKAGDLDEIKEMYDKEAGKSTIDLFFMHAACQMAADMDVVEASGDVKAKANGTVVAEDEKDRDDSGRFL